MTIHLVSVDALTVDWSLKFHISKGTSTLIFYTHFTLVPLSVLGMKGLVRQLDGQQSEP